MKQLEEHHISRVIDGVTMSGTYSVEDGIITVTTALGTKSTQVADSPPEVLARIMLRELLDDMRTGFPSSLPKQPQ
jgi:hypothetical protein